MRTLRMGLVIAVGSLAMVACQPGTTSQTTDMTTETEMSPSPTSLMMASPSPTLTFDTSRTIAENAGNSADHTTLLTAVRAAGIEQTLASTGPLTVFAPTNAAFNKLPAGTVESLLQMNNRTRLTSILTYHAVPGTYRAADLRDGMTLKTVLGEDLTVEVDGGIVRINGAVVTRADLQASNGVVHVIDTVLMPPSMR